MLRQHLFPNVVHSQPEQSLGRLVRLLQNVDQQFQLGLSANLAVCQDPFLQPQRLGVVDKTARLLLADHVVGHGFDEEVPPLRAVVHHRVVDRKQARGLIGADFHVRIDDGPRGQDILSCHPLLAGDLRQHIHDHTHGERPVSSL